MGIGVKEDVEKVWRSKAGELCDMKFGKSRCRKRSAAKGVRSLFFVFGTPSVTFSDAFVTFFVTFLPDSFCRTPFAAGGHLANLVNSGGILAKFP